MIVNKISPFGEISVEREAEFINKGIAKRYFFPSSHLLSSQVRSGRHETHAAHVREC